MNDLASYPYPMARVCYVQGVSAMFPPGSSRVRRTRADGQ